LLHQIVDRGGIPNPEVTHDWLISALGLDCFPICRREYQPRKWSGPLRWMAAKNAGAASSERAPKSGCNDRGDQDGRPNVGPGNSTK